MARQLQSESRFTHETPTQVASALAKPLFEFVYLHLTVFEEFKSSKRERLQRSSDADRGMIGRGAQYSMVYVRA